MKKMVYKIIAGICALNIALGLTGCDSVEQKVETEEAQKPAVCFVIANTANSQGLNFNSPLIQDTILACAENYGFVSVINADGNSEVVIAESLDIDERYKNASAERLEMDARSKANNILSYMQAVVADDPEIDYLEALRLGCRMMSSLEGYTSKSIIVLGTGLCSTGYMDFNNNLISADPLAVADLLEEKKAIPDFSDITSVYWQGLGETAEPQASLSPAQCINLQDIWSAVISRGNGELVLNDFISNPVNTSIEYPFVSVVDLPAETPVKFNPKDFKYEEEVNAFEAPLVLSEEQVTFIPDKSEYLNPDKAMATIRPIAEYLSEYKEVTILLAGTTAGDEDNDYTCRLSEERAAAVRNTLIIEFGIEKERIKTVGLGSSDPWHVPGAGYDGSIASNNRKVVLLDASTDLAQEIMKQ